MLPTVRAEFLGVHGIYFSKLHDPHPAADAFIAASDDERAEIRARCDQILADRIARGVAALHASPPRAPLASKYAKRRDIDCPIDVERVRVLAASGNSLRAIEKITGIGRNRIRRALDGQIPSKAPKKHRVLQRNTGGKFVRRDGTYRAKERRCVLTYEWTKSYVRDARGRFISRILKNAA